MSRLEILTELFGKPDPTQQIQHMKLSKRDLSIEVTMAEMASLLHNLGETDPSRPGGAIVLADMFHRCVGLDVDRWLLRPAVPAAHRRVCTEP